MINGNFFLFKDQQLPAVSLPRSLGQGQHASGQGLLHSPLSIPPVAAAERHGMYRVTDMHFFILEFLLNVLEFYVE